MKPPSGTPDGTNPTMAPETEEIPAKSPSDALLLRKATDLAETLLTEALRQQTPPETAESAKLARLMEDPGGKAFTFAMVDEVFRSHRPAIVAERWRRLLGEHGSPRYLTRVEGLLMRVGAFGSRILPRFTMKAVEERMRRESSRVILPGEAEPLHRYLTRRRSEGFRLNLNQLGEAVLGEAEATRRLDAVLAHLADPAVDYVSVKISAIFSQIQLVAWDSTLAEIQARLRVLYRVAKSLGKFVNLDMEEYRDLALTIAAFRGVLDEPEFHSLSAGIVLQAYLPDSVAAQAELTEWAVRRIAAGGAPIKIRIVKGANLAMEAVEAEMHGWHPAPYATKEETDANYRRLLDHGCHPDRVRAARLGVASHNLFDVALALTLREERKVAGFVEIEMLEGMANHQARAVRDEAGGLLLYAPAVRRDDFLSAMAYLVRRLDENTAPDNFLHDLFAMKPGTAAWERQRLRFERGWLDRHSVSDRSRRETPAVHPENAERFQNEPDTDWTLCGNRESLATAIRAWKAPSAPTLPELDEVLDTAVKARPAWESRSLSERAAILRRAATVMSAGRFETLACLQENGKKALPEADAEVSEAIDFARYYAETGVIPPGTVASALGVVAVISPWNFPYAIPAGGVLAGLMAGNSVILKPARATAATAWRLAEQLWEAGVPREVLQCFPCDNEVGRRLIEDPRLAAVILTGGWETARRFRQWRPSLRLFAETSGKNAMVITAQADRELAIRDLVRSAFGHAGQKCSAASLAILEAEVYDDPVFRRQLRDTAASLPVGPASDLRNVVTPLVNGAGPDLLRALTTLDEGETWLLEPRRPDEEAGAWTPGIKLGVRPGSWFHRTECFGPVLGLMRATSLSEATEWQNASDFGLTAGLHSLDPKEIAWWKERVEAGNLYVNRPITGAIVQRQPFGGWKRSCVGPGAKAGGPNYVHAFRTHRDPLDAGEDDYEDAWREIFSRESDPSGLKCEANVFRYRSCRGVVLRLGFPDPVEIKRARKAATVTGSPLEISLATEESEAAFLARLPRLANEAEFLRTVVPPSDDVLRAAFDAGLNWIDAPFPACGRIELTRWLREQSVSETRHRYGQLHGPESPRSRKAVTSPTAARGS